MQVNYFQVNTDLAAGKTRMAIRKVDNKPDGTTLFATNSLAQAPWKIVDMEYVTKHGGNCTYDDETCTATFKGGYDRWIDLPGLSGDLTGHTNLKATILKSNVILTFNVRYKDADGKTQQVKAQTFYGRMSKEITAKKTLKVDLTNKGKIGDDILKNVVSVRVSMAKQSGGAEEPWFCQFGDIVVK